MSNARYTQTSTQNFIKWRVLMRYIMSIKYVVGHHKVNYKFTMLYRIFAPFKPCYLNFILVEIIFMQNELFGR